MRAEKAGIILPVTREAYDKLDFSYFQMMARDEFDRLGMCLPETIEYDIVTDRQLQEINLGFNLPADQEFVFVAFTAMVIPKEDTDGRP